MGEALAEGTWPTGNLCALQKGNLWDVECSNPSIPQVNQVFKEWGFTMNPYEPCVWNKTINGKQFTIVSHVDDIKLSHIDPLIVTMIIKMLMKEYGKLDQLSINWGKKHEYLGMNIDFSVKHEVRITMCDYVEKLIRQLPSDMIGTKKTTAENIYSELIALGYCLTLKIRKSSII
jgi:hypothetical protein